MTGSRLILFPPGRLTTESDIYSLGVVLLEMLTGLPALDPAEEVVVLAARLGLMPVLAGSNAVAMLAPYVDPAAGWTARAAGALSTLIRRCLHCELFAPLSMDRPEARGGGGVKSQGRLTGD